MHEVLDERTFQRHMSTGNQLTGHSIRTDKIFLQHFPGTRGPLEKRLPVQHEEWQGILVCNLQNQKS